MLLRITCPAFSKRDATDYWTICCLFKRVDLGLKLGRGLVTERGVFAVIAVVGIDEVEDLGAGVATVDEAAVLEHFGF